MSCGNITHGEQRVRFPMEKGVGGVPIRHTLLIKNPTAATRENKNYISVSSGPVNHVTIHVHVDVSKC